MTSTDSRQYDVFISYRRDDGAELARLVRYALMDRGYKAFLDVESLGSGQFDDRLLDSIGAAPGFVIILSKNALVRCHDPEDWVRKEIAHAISTQRTIVPVMADNFTFSGQAIPAELEVLQRHNGLNYNHDYFEAMISRLIEYLGLAKKTMSASAPPSVPQKPPPPFLVFLDFDGVLRPIGSSPYVFDIDCLARFEALVRKHSTMQIVVTSSWRRGMSRHELVSQFAPDIQRRIIGVTPEIDEEEGPDRQREIMEYLRKAGAADSSWIAIDDDPDRFKRGCVNLLLTDPDTGFDSRSVDRFEAMLAAHIAR